MKFAWALGALLLCAFPAKADNIGIVGNATFTDFVFGNPGQPPTGSLGTVESVETSFIYNTTSEQISELNFNSNGPLGPFTFAGIEQFSATSVGFNWTSSQAELSLFVPALPTETTPLEGVGTTKGLGMVCLSQSCIADFGGGFNIGGFNINDEKSFTEFTWLSADSPSDTPSPTPEPSSLVLMGVGLVGIVSFMRSKFIVSCMQIS